MGDSLSDAHEARACDAPGSTAAAPRVLIVGGTGLVGRHLVARLAASGRALRILSRNAEDKQLGPHGDLVELFEGSCLDPERLDAALDGVTAVCYLTKGEGRSWQDYLDNAVEPVRRVAEAALRRGVQRFIYAGSIDSYASSRTADCIDGTTPLDPDIGRRNHCSRSKAVCKHLLSTMASKDNLPLVILRLRIVIGPGGPLAHSGVGRFIGGNRVTYWCDGKYRLPFVLVQDAADALVRALDVPDIEGCSFLITDAPLLSARDICRRVANAIGRHRICQAARDLALLAVRHCAYDAQGRDRAPQWFCVHSA